MKCSRIGFKWKINSLIIVTILCLQVSCSQKSKIEDTFINSKTDYWKYKDNCGSHGIYFKFYKDGTFDKFNRYLDGFALFNNDGDLVSGPRNWFLYNDSILAWGDAKYKVEFYSNDKIILSYNKGNCRITLSKTN